MPLHKAALNTGGKDNGKPGLRAVDGPNCNSVLAVDPDDHRLEAWRGKAAWPRVLSVSPVGVRIARSRH